MATKTTRETIPMLKGYVGRSKRAREARAQLAERHGVDEDTVLRWVNREELPPDDVIVSLLNPCGPLGHRIAFELGWKNAPRSAIPDRWRLALALDTALRVEYILPRACNSLLALIDERLAVEADLLDDDSLIPDSLVWREPDGGVALHDATDLQRLRQALIEFMAEPLDDEAME